MDPNSNTQTFDMQPNILNILGHDSIPEPERISENFTYTNEELVEMQEWDLTLIDGLEDEPSLYVEDEWDNVHGDLIFFR